MLHAKAQQELECDVAIVGGGPSGVYSLYRLAPVLHDRVCLFEANDYFGGRVKDVEAPNGKGVFGVGALRVQETQNLLFNLAKELGFDLTQQTGNYKVPYGSQRVFAKGHVTGDVNSFLQDPKLYQAPVPNAEFPDPASGYVDGQYPDSSTAWNCDGDANYNGCYNDAYYHALLNPKYTPAPKQYRNNTLWLKDVLTPEGFQFLTDGFRFRGDFENNIDALSYIGFLTEDWDACCNPTYPEGGMSSFVKGMMNSAVANGARAFTSEPVRSIGKAKSQYKLKSAHYAVSANSVIIAVPAEPFKKVGGSIAARIKAQPEFKAIKGIRVISVDNWWKNAWWDGTQAEGGGTLDRAWATKDGVAGELLCFNAMEFGHTPYHKNQMVTRSVYNDDKACVEFWARLYKKKGLAGINEEIIREYKIVFPEVAAQLSVDQIQQTAYQDWPAAWYWLKGPTTITNARVAVWAVEPLSGEKVSLIGESYNPNRSGWVDGALKSAINSLNYNYSNAPQHNARITAYLQAPLNCSSVDLVNGSLAYIPFNQDGNFNANCPLQ
ncbi:FAD-dependent oxidoreductase [Methylomicrobium lacus]|uniref:FAD-dependent oxidoreductase n=1 Tax=Methylomicrobium lacus TaxID=136992 RepID=UPI0035A90BA4